MNIKKLLKIISNPVRLDILHWLANPAQHFAELAKPGAIEEDNSVCVGLIQEKSGLSQSTISNYLALMESAGLVKSRRKGNWIHYSRDEKTIKALLDYLNHYL